MYVDSQTPQLSHKIFKVHWSVKHYSEATYITGHRVNVPASIPLGKHEEPNRKAASKDSLKLQKEGKPDHSIREQLTKFGWNPTLEKNAEWQAIDNADGHTPGQTLVILELDRKKNTAFITEEEENNITRIEKKINFGGVFVHHFQNYFL